MSIISAGNTTTTALVQTADTSGNLVFTTGGANTTALTITNAQAATFAGNVNITGTTTQTGNASFSNVTASGTATVTGATSLNAGLAVSGGRTFLKANSEQFSLGLQYNSSTGQTYIGSTNSASPDMIFSNVSGTELGRFTTGGNFYVGTTGIPNVGVTGQYGFSVSSTEVVISKNVASPALYIKNASSGASTAIIFYNGETQVGYVTTTTTGTTYNSGSDYRLKENVQPLTNALNTVAKLKPSIYKWKIDGSEGKGFIAHELQEVFPSAVVGEKDAVDKDGKPAYQGVDQSKLVVLLTAALQELNAKVDAQTQRITDLEEQVLNLGTK